MGKESSPETRPQLNHLSGPDPVFISSKLPEMGLLDLFLTGRRERYWQRWEQALADFDQRVREVFEEDLAQKGLLGEHELLALSQQRGFWADARGEWALEGHLFLLFGGLQGRGEIESHTRTVSSLQFAWSASPGEVLISEVPVVS
jgi:hypothetical protein